MRRIKDWQTLLAAVSVSVSLLTATIGFVSGCVYAGNRILILAYTVGGAMNQHQQIIDAQIKAQQRQDEMFRLIADRCK